jgi:superfamily II DNA/RNA helicase
MNTDPVQGSPSDPPAQPDLDRTALAARAPVRPDSPTFEQLEVRPETVAALQASGIVRAFAIQEYALPIALRGADLIGQAPTGTGKTLAFGIPILERVLAPDEGGHGQPQALVVVPTRELGLQVARDIQAAGRSRGVRVLPVYGGVAYEPQFDALTTGVEVVVGTPGRLLDLSRPARGKSRPILRLDQVAVLVLDEADRMLDLGFLDDVEQILAMLPSQRHTMLFSATMPDPIVMLARRFMHQPVTVRAQHHSEASSPQTRQLAYRTHSLNKVEVLSRILQVPDRGLAMIFTRTKRAADRVAEDLDFRGFAAAAVHGDLGQGTRERALRAFRNGKIDVLVATDVAARGLDVLGVTHVINYDCPEDADAYTHRIGRTGRAGATGVAVTFVDWDDMPRWRIIDKTLGLDLPEPPETYHTSAHLFADLSIGERVTGTLPSAERTRAGIGAEVEEDLGGRRPGAGPRGRRTTRGRSEAPAEATPVRGPRRRRRIDPDPTSSSPVDAAGPAEMPARPPRSTLGGRSGRARAATGTPAAAPASPPAGVVGNQAPATADGAAPRSETGTPQRRRRNRARGTGDGAGKGRTAVAPEG